MKRIVMERYDNAWSVPGEKGNGVLLRHPDTEGAFWLVCPAAATLYFWRGKPEDLLDCQLGEECDHDDVHRNAVALVVELVAGNDTKVCSKCQERKPLSRFTALGLSPRDYKPRYAAACKECRRELDRAARVGRS